MAKLGHLLAATDFSAPARHAAERAAIVARCTGAILDLIHVTAPDTFEQIRRLVGDLPAGIEQQLLDECRAELRQLAAGLMLHHGISAGCHGVSGRLLDEIGSHAESLNADLLVFGARGSSFVRRLLLGSTAERMLSQNRFPMLVVKQAAHEPYKSLLVPVDFSAPSRRALANAIAIAPNARITLLHTAVLPFEGKLKFAGVDDATIINYQLAAESEARLQLQVLRDGAGDAAACIELRIARGDPSLRIVELEQELDCDLIVIGKQGAGGIDDFLPGSVTRHVLGESQCDILISV